MNGQFPLRALESQTLYYVYFIAQEVFDFVKIGSTGNIVARLRQLQTGNPHRLIPFHIIAFESMEGARRVEAIFHKRYQALGLNAQGEWYQVKPIEVLNDLNFAIALGESVTGQQVFTMPDLTTGRVLLHRELFDVPYYSDWRPARYTPSLVAQFLEEEGEGSYERD
jgi:hypothetical protein